MTATPASETITVLLSTGASSAGTQFVNQLLGGATDAVEYEHFSWKTALTGRYDVFHIHWPEMLVRDSRSRVRAFFKRRRMQLLLARLAWRRIPIVRTYHNPRPHEPGRHAEQRLLEKIDARTTLFIALNEHTRPEWDARSVVIPHGHYLPMFESFGWPQAVPGRIVYFGLIRPYKNVEALLAAFRELDLPDASLHVVGSPHRGQEQAVRAAAGGDPRIELTLRYVDDEEVVSAVREASLVVLPYREMRNSGALLVAATLGRPALVPASEVNELLAGEFGHEWVRQYTGELDAPALASHLRAVEDSGLLAGRGPDISRRDWYTVGRSHEEAYRLALKLAGHPEFALSPGSEFPVTNRPPAPAGAQDAQ